MDVYRVNWQVETFDPETLRREKRDVRTAISAEQSKAIVAESQDLAIAELGKGLAKNQRIVVKAVETLLRGVEIAAPPAAEEEEPEEEEPEPRRGKAR